MLVNFRSAIRSQPRNIPFFPKFKPQTLTKTLAMAAHSAPNNRRPICPSCTRPVRLCLCTRFKTPILENSIAVTLLQHSLEKKHPLNSAKIATLGLKNINLAHVSDVLSEAHFDLHLLESNLDMDLNESVKKHKKIESLHVSDSLNQTQHNAQLFESNLGLGLNDSIEEHKKIESLQPADISFTIDKRGLITSLVNNFNQTQDFDQILGDRCMINSLRNGFIVKKIRKGIDGNYVKEFEIEVPSGSILLFPSENSIGIEEIDFNVKNLIVLDGTWGKALRMYKENPWLKMLPHLKLEIDKLSLYGEVRRQPKVGCLSSIESIVYALKAVGKEDHKGLDCLLDVFESMVVDQRRCKNERLELESDISSM